VRFSALLVPLLCLSACKDDPLYCDETRPCADPARPFCDLTGEHPASEGIPRTCIPNPTDAGTNDTIDAANNGESDGNMPDGASGTDARPACTWAPLSRLANVNSSDGQTPGSLDPDGLTLYFSRLKRQATVNNDLYFAARGTVGQAFGEPTLIDELSTDDDEVEPEISSSGLEIFYRFTSNPLDIFSSIQTATRTSATGTFGAAVPTGFHGFSPALSGDGLALYFLDVQGGTVLRATRAAIGAPWSRAVSVFPSEGYLGLDVSPDELRLLLTINPFLFPPNPIAIAERTSIEEPFGSPLPVNDEILVPDGAAYVQAKWDGTQTIMVVGVQLTGQARVDMYYSLCQ